ncbi:MAG TPA: 4Fe-4S dicluster domain-containing protein [Polyangiaceae bacterium]|nr:4Fe-4S dicluster domain-containing protein [Polyangiaceae bacterium]
MSEYWRSVLEACGGPAAIAEGTPAGGAGALGRRELIQLLGASLALAGLAGCGQRPRERILPYVATPRDLTPGLAQDYATSMELDGFAVGLLVKSHEGRPTKVEGNPLHPASLGASSVYQQASVLSLYDPSRLRAPLELGLPSSWDAAFAALRGPKLRGPAPWRPWFVLPPQSSPLVLQQLDLLREIHPAARFTFHAALSRQAIYQATDAVFGEPLEPQPDFAASQVVLALDADFLSQGPMSLRWARDFSARRAPRPSVPEPNRLYAVESTLSPTGSVADHRLALRPSELPRLAALLLAELARSDARARLPGLQALGELPSSESSPHQAWIRALASDLLKHWGECLVVAGPQQPFETQVLALALNGALGSFGRTLRLTRSALADPLGSSSLADLRQASEAREVDALIVLDCDPLYDADPALGLEQALGRVPITAQLTQHLNATSRACRWLLPQSHYLESWGDSRAFDGTLSLLQPLIDPLYASRSVLELLAACAGAAAPSGYSLARRYWRGQLSALSDADFSAEWAARLQRGLVQDSAFTSLRREPDWSRALTLARSVRRPEPEGSYELELAASPNVYDGRFAHNAWLLELPEAVTKQSWGNALRISAEDAARLGLSTGSLVELSRAGRTLQAPVVVVHGQAPGTLALARGYGQRGTGTLADGVGVDARALWEQVEGSVAKVELRPTGERRELAIRQLTQQQHGRGLALSTRLSAYRRDPDFTREARGKQPSLLPVVRKASTGPLAGVQWGMTIDTTLCTGCNACVVACQAENNVPVVGAREAERGHLMHWLRIDTYEAEGEAPPGVIHQPMLCQHCENAPCEYVCPVNATTHSPDGLNEMAYNRCIGTRFCSNNCPYKVRRFNWFDYSDDTPLARLQKNPEVSVRERGVMEKCTYCVQRIRGAERQARIERREVQPGEVVTACQQACSAQAIQFGALGHAGTPVVEWRQEPRVYEVLHELGTRPRTVYLAKVSNENPELEG